MKPNVDFAECLKDSPYFRASLEETEGDIDLLETRLEKLVKLCTSMIEAGKAFNTANSAFISGVKDVSNYFHDDDLVSAVLARCVNTLSEIQKYHNILLDQANRSICKNLQTFIKTDIRKVKETRKHFEKLSDDMDNALIKNAQAPASKPQDCEDANKMLTAMRTCFGHKSLDYVYEINILHSKKRFDVLDTMLAYMHAQSTFFHQGYDLYADLEPYMKQIAAQIEELSTKAASRRKAMEERHTLVQERELALTTPQPEQSEASEIRREGYLFKRTSNAFKTWVRRWFMIQNNQLVYRKRSKDNLTVMEEDLRLCTVKLNMDIDRRYCFEVVSPTRNHVLQADSEHEFQAWIRAIQAGVSKAYRDTPHEPEAQQQVQPQRPLSVGSGDLPTLQRNSPKPGKHCMEQILKIPGNSKCCDCGSPEPRWASINLGITLCIECSGIHRSLGVHMSKVRSLTLDAWEPEVLKVMVDLGNSAVNGIFEAKVDETIAKRATPECQRPIREAWIRAKYAQKSFVARLVQDQDGSQADGSGIAASGKRWGVQKRKRRSPGKNDEGVSVVGGEGIKLPTETSQDSGLGDGSPDVLVFGTSVNNPEEAHQRSIDNLSDTDDSDQGEDVESTSTTSFEDLSKLQPDLLLFKAAVARNLPVMLQALANGGDPNWQNEEVGGLTPLIKAVESGSMAPVEFLLLNGAKVDRKDGKGRSPLHHAVIQGNTGQVCQFLKRHANQGAIDEDGNDPLSIAVKNANADIVTLLRLAKLNEEMKESEGIYAGTGDETFNEVFRDFTHMANNTPERLHRNKTGGATPQTK